MPDFRISGASANDRSESDIRLNIYNSDLVIGASLQHCTCPTCAMHRGIARGPTH